MSLRQRLLSALLTTQVSENVVPQSVPASGLSLELTTLRLIIDRWGGVFGSVPSDGYGVRATPPHVPGGSAPAGVVSRCTFVSTSSRHRRRLAHSRPRRRTDGDLLFVFSALRQADFTSLRATAWAGLDTGLSTNVCGISAVTSTGRLTPVRHV